MRSSGLFSPGAGPARRRPTATRALIVALAAAGLLVAAPAGPATAGGVPAHAGGGTRPDALGVDHLQADDLTTPLGIDDPAPKLSWRVSGGSTAAVQTGYEVRAATRPDLLVSGRPDLWDSGRVPSSQVGDVSYGGRRLDSRERVFWQVRSWSAAGVSSWSAPASWEMGLLSAGDWTAKWIEDPRWTDPSDRWPVFGTTFTVKSTPASARLYVTGLGMETTTVNGRPIGDAVLEPGESDYRTEVQYRTYDVAKLLHPGVNRIQIATGSGWYLQTAQAGKGGRFGGLGSNNGATGAPRVIGQLEITGRDGRRQTVATGPDWLTAAGPTTFSSWFGGEDYDAGLAAQVGTVPVTADTTWGHAADSVLTGTVGQPTTAPGVPTTPRADTPLVANPRLPVTVVATHKAVAITNPSPGVYVFDFGRNFSGWPVLDLKHPIAGQTIQIVPGEGPSLTSAGLVTQSWSTTNGTRYDYVPSSAAHQTWHPSFAYSGFRWLQVSGLSTPPTANTVHAQQLMTANPVTSTFSSSMPLLNQIDSLVRSADEANMESVLTDCPNREKAPYTGDTAQDIDSELNNYDLRGYLAATMRNFAEAQQPTGEVLSTGPEWHTIENGTNWGGAIVEVPWAMYQAYGDTSVLSSYYTNMSRYIDFTTSRATGNLITYGLADWETSDPNPPTAAYTNSYGYYVQVEDMAKIAAVLGKTDDAAKYLALGRNIAAAFNTAYFDSATHTYANGDVADDALALDAGLVPAGRRNQVLDHLLTTIAANKGLITVGSVSLEPVIRVLHSTGHDDVLYKWATSTAYPSYGYIVAQGATTMTETWDLNPKESQDHHFLGGIDAWFTSGLAGIGQAPDTVGFSHPVIKPSVSGTTTGVKGDYTSAYGTITDDWSLTGPSDRPAGLTMRTSVPVGSPATVEVPQLGSARVLLEDGHVIWTGGKAAKGTTVTVDGDYLAVGGVTGTHTFTWRATR